MQITISTNIQSLDTSASAVQRQASAGDVAKFEDVFNFTPIQEVPKHDPMNMETAFLAGLKQANLAHDSMVTHLDAALNKVTQDPHLTMSSLLDVQMQLAAVSFHEQLTVKVVDKSTEGLKTLFRNQ